MKLNSFSGVHFGIWFSLIYLIEWGIINYQHLFPLHFVFWFVFSFAAEITLIILIKKILCNDIDLRGLSLIIAGICLGLGVLKELWDAGVVMSSTSTGTGFDFVDIYFDIAGIVSFIGISFMIKKALFEAESIKEKLERILYRWKEYGGQQHIDFVLDPNAAAPETSSSNTQSNQLFYPQ